MSESVTPVNHDDANGSTNGLGSPHGGFSIPEAKDGFFGYNEERSLQQVRPMLIHLTHVRLLITKDLSSSHRPRPNLVPLGSQTHLLNNLFSNGHVQTDLLTFDTASPP